MGGRSLDRGITPGTPGAPSLGRDHGYGHPHPSTVETDRGGWLSLDDRTSKDDVLAGRPEKYLRPELIRQVTSLDPRTKFTVEGFVAGRPIDQDHINPRSHPVPRVRPGTPDNHLLCYIISFMTHVSVVWPSFLADPPVGR